MPYVTQYVLEAYEKKSNLLIGRGVKWSSHDTILPPVTQYATARDIFHKELLQSGFCDDGFIIICSSSVTFLDNTGKENN